MKRAIFVAPSLAALLAGCGHSGSATTTTMTSDPVTRGTLALRSVDWNANKTDVGNVVAVADVGESAAVFSDKGMSLFVAGAVSSSDPSVTAWQSAGVIPAADGEGVWIVGVAGDGRVLSIDANQELEDVSDRFALLGQHVDEVASLGGSQSAFRLDTAVAIADGTAVTRYDLAITSVSGATGKLAGVSSGAVHVFDTATGEDRAYALDGAAFVTFDGSGKLVAATSKALYGEGDGTGGLEELIAIDEGVHGLAGTPAGVWVAMGGELGLLAGDTLAVSSGAKLPADATIAASSSGDAWALSQGALTRYSTASEGDEAQWTASVLPVFTRVCSTCHLPGGTANIDLSYYGAWAARRQLIGQRVLDGKPTPMPPTSSSTMLSADDTAAIKAWVDGSMP